MLGISVTFASAIGVKAKKICFFFFSPKIRNKIKLKIMKGKTLTWNSLSVTCKYWQWQGDHITQLKGASIFNVQDMMTYAYNPSTQEAEADESQSSKPAWSSQQVPDQPRLHSETASQRRKTVRHHPNINWYKPSDTNPGLSGSKILLLISRRWVSGKLP